MIKRSDVTIIIPHIFLSKETDFSIRECLKSLDETVPDIKKIVAINGTKLEEDFETVRYPNVEFLVMERQGQCVATNAAIATTNTPWILITNNDMIYPPGWWEELTDLMSFNGKDILCISPQLVEPRPGAPTFDVFFAGGAGGDFKKELFLGYLENDQSVDMVRPGFNTPFLIRRDLWDIVGGYDINYDPWGSNSDSDLEYKIKLAGVQPYQTTSCKVYHFSQTSGTFHPSNDSYRFKNYGYFREKWGFERIGSPQIWEASFEIPTVEEGRIYKTDWEGKWS